MANVEHRTMVSANVHEPKHISDSTASDAGKVITPLSGGASELRNLTPEEVGVQQIYGEIAVDANTTPFSITAASDTTLYTESDYVALNSTRIPTAYADHSNGVTYNATTNGLIIPVTGFYRVSFWMNVETDVNNTKVGFKAKENGTWCNFTVKHDLPALGRVQLVAGHIITDLTAGNEITLHVASDKTANLIIQDGRYTVELLRAT